MLVRTISTAEHLFIRSGCDHGLRLDGRGHENYRSFLIENDVFPQTNSSIRLKVENNIDIMCSVMVDAVPPDPKNPEEGKVEVNVDISPAGAVGFDDKDIQLFSFSIADRIQRSYYGTPLFPLKSLCILSGKFVWKVCIDILVLQFDGSLIDSCSLAAYLALQKLRIPQTELTIGKNQITQELEEFEIVPDFSKTLALDFSQIPILVSITKIGKFLLVDATNDEQDTASAVVVIGVDRKGDISSIDFAKAGSVSSEDWTQIFEKTLIASGRIFQQLDSFVQSKSFRTADEQKYADVPPTRTGFLA